ncbi:MAG: serine/threonine protein kinase [Phycisphaerae bacterium]|nr:serine/threonine protein kinase [Phycisphaerae bacterium]|tara:strand:- start:99 stop:1358 length:1260 start_codon:yes stop_codon:yes gene_type:complete
MSSKPDPNQSSAPESSGFETMLGKLVVDQGLITDEELLQCNSELLAARADGEVNTLEEALITHDFVTQRQLDRLRKEFEDTKSSLKIPGYRMVKKLGAGAMATVFLAEQKSLKRQVAIKILPQKFSEDLKTRFYDEGRAAAKLNHPNIVHAYEVGQAGEHHFFVMEYVEGSDVRQEIKDKKRLTEDKALEIMIQSAKALEHAHSKGLIHRDIKPANIMLTRNGTVKVADLGLARSVDDIEMAEKEAGRAYGTANYMSPEQIRGKVDIGPSADIYGLGGTCYHMVTGRVPFTGKNPSEVMRRHLKAPLTRPDDLNPSLSPGFCQVIEMMLAKDPSDRYESMTDLLEDLELVQRGDSPHFAKPAVDLSSLAVNITPDSASAEIPAAVPRRDSRSNVSALLITSIGINIVLAIIVVAILATS